jgi:REP element-mobilizing transposase RayT
MMKITNKPPRFKQEYGTFFLTFCTYERANILLEPGVPEMLIENIRFYGARLQNLIAYTIMHDHMHLLVEIAGILTLSAFLRDFKKHTSREIRRLIETYTRYVWQRGTVDHWIRPCQSGRDLSNHLTYLFLNSWKHLQIPPRMFPYHNLEEAIARGYVSADAFEDENFQEIARS